jgi:hypothetical protein
MQRFLERTRAGRNAPATQRVGDPTAEVLIEGFFAMSAMIQDMHILLAQQGMVAERLPFEMSAVNDPETAREYVTRRTGQLEDMRSAIRAELLGRANPERRQKVKQQKPAEDSTVRVALSETRVYSSQRMRKFGDEVMTDADKLRELLFYHVNLLRGKDLPASEAVVVDEELLVLPDLQYLARLVHTTTLGIPKPSLIDLKILRSQSFAVLLTGDGGLTLQQAVESAVAADRKLIRISGAVSVSEPVVISGRSAGLVIEGLGRFASVRGSGCGCFSLVGNANVLFKNLTILGVGGCGVEVAEKATARIEGCEVSGHIGVRAKDDSRVFVNSSEMARCDECAISGSETAVVEMNTSKISQGLEGLVLSGKSYATISDSFIRDTTWSGVRIGGQAVAKILFSSIVGCGGEFPGVRVGEEGGLASSGTEISVVRNFALDVAEGGKVEMVDMRILGKGGALRISGNGSYRKFVCCKIEGALEIATDAKVVARGCSQEFPGTEPRIEVKETSL